MSKENKTRHRLLSIAMTKTDTLCSLWCYKICICEQPIVKRLDDPIASLSCHCAGAVRCCPVVCPETDPGHMSTSRPQVIWQHTRTAI